jgi:hypothetical protein
MYTTGATVVVRERFGVVVDDDRLDSMVRKAKRSAETSRSSTNDQDLSFQRKRHDDEGKEAVWRWSLTPPFL